MSKTLSESAAEILKASMNAGKEPMQSLNAPVTDLGGQTPTETPDEVGVKAAAAVKTAQKPGNSEEPGDVKMNSVKAKGLAKPASVDATMHPNIGEETEKEDDEDEDEDEKEDMKEEIEQVDEAKGGVLHTGAVNGEGFEIRHNSDNAFSLDPKKLHSLVAKQNPHLEKHQVKAIVASKGKPEHVADHPILGRNRLSVTNDPKENWSGKGSTQFKPYNEEMDNSAVSKELVLKHMGSMKEDVDALFNGESLSEDFRVKATLIFEAAVSSRVEKIVEEVLAENDEILSAAYEEIKSELSEQVDEYLNYVVEEWVNENQVAIETGLRSELAEDFINGLKNLFAEHYIEIPEEKVDVAEELAATVVEMQEAVAEKDAAIAALTEEVNQVKKEKAIVRACEGLTQVQGAKMKSLAESVEFTTDGDFEHKLAVIRENYFPSKSNVTSEVKEIQKTAVNEEPEVAQAHGIMAHYVKAISKTAPRA